MFQVPNSLLDRRTHFLSWHVSETDNSTATIKSPLKTKHSVKRNERSKFPVCLDRHECERIVASIKNLSLAIISPIGYPRFERSISTIRRRINTKECPFYQKISLFFKSSVSNLPVKPHVNPNAGPNPMSCIRLCFPAGLAENT